MAVPPRVDAIPPSAWCWQAVPETVAIARRAVVSVLRAHGREDERARDIALAVSEAVTNVVRHAYGGTAGGLVRMAVAQSQDEVLIEVSDDGQGMLPASPARGLGLGLPLMARLSDSLEVERRTAGGTSVRIRFRRQARRRPPPRG